MSGFMLGLVFIIFITGCASTESLTGGIIITLFLYGIPALAAYLDFEINHNRKEKNEIDN